MRLLISCQKKLSSSALMQHIERRLHFALDRFSGLVREVKVRVFDENGPKGGADKVVRAVVLLENGEGIRIESRGADLYGTADWLADRLKAAIARACERRKGWRSTRIGREMEWA
ncbi:MAG: HPF/RaiA family ribosome-associated protein [Oligoflexia bacterium]|nr:HPF/RaiA family ribosome-associated protein [Oligoflexia bacterium]